MGFSRDEPWLYFSGDNPELLDVYPELGYLRDIVYLLKAFMAPTSDALPPVGYRGPVSGRFTVVGILGGYDRLCSGVVYVVVGLSGQQVSVRGGLRMLSCRENMREAPQGVGVLFVPSSKLCLPFAVLVFVSGETVTMRGAAKSLCFAFILLCASSGLLLGVFQDVNFRWLSPCC